MLSYNTSIKIEKSYTNLELQEIKPIMKLIVRGKTREFISAIGKSLDMILPIEANTSTSGENLTAFWLSPDEWMLISNDVVKENSNTYGVEDNLINNISKTNLGAIIDVSDQFVIINIKGAKVFDLFATGSPFNFNEFKNKKGSVVQTILSHIDVIIHHKEINEVNLLVRRSFSEHLYSWLNDSASRL
ncbi:sarcosine oxidase subunit gamma [Candidatus Pelagibacter sp.]|jgi:sarcosine oxidase, subunit gamma|nr:sarcosine oxidase subunit gamma [Candidatus Pelagibacter sp.]